MVLVRDLGSGIRQVDLASQGVYNIYKKKKQFRGFTFFHQGQHIPLLKSQATFVSYKPIIVQLTQMCFIDLGSAIRVSFGYGLSKPPPAVITCNTVVSNACGQEK